MSKESMNVTVGPVKVVNNPFLSKTNWAAFLVATASFFPEVKTWVANHPEAIMQVLSGVFFVLRFFTNKQLVKKA